MVGYIKVVFWWLIPLFLIFNSVDNQKQFEFNEIKHSISIKHPGEEGTVEVVLIEVQNKNGLPVEYYMDVESVICLEEVCKVIPVTVFWNNIGEYKKYKLEEGATLEKYEANLFEPNDYKKIHTILQNKNSPFKDVYLEDIWTVPSTLSEDVDAVSGATILELDENDTVPGATLTCYTLWHWANGNIVSVIRNQTGESVSEDQLKEFIANNNETYFNIALSALKRRNIYDESFVDAIIHRVLNEGFLLKEAIAYIEKSPTDEYLKTLSGLFFKGKKEHKLSVIRSLNNSKIKIPKSYLDALSEGFILFESFQETSALFELMQNKNQKSLVVNNNAMPLLDSDFLIARRAFWFLCHQELTSSQKKILQEFYRRNKERL